MKLFNFKRFGRSESQQHLHKGVLVRNFEKGYAFIQRKWAKWMARKAGGLPRQNLYALFILFTVVSMTYCVYLIASGLLGRVEPELKLLKVESIYRVGVQTPNQAAEFIPNDTFEIKNIKEIRRFMDSIAQSPTGRKAFDSTAAAHPGLLDSLSIIEKIYKLKSKN